MNKQNKKWYAQGWAIALFIILGVIVIMMFWSNWDNNHNTASNNNQVTPSNTNHNTASIIDVCNARSYIGKEIAVQGIVVEVYKSGTSSIFLNFGNAYPRQCFYGVIFSRDFNKFPNIQSYEGKEVVLNGLVQEYQGRIEIILESPEQVKFVE
jgi:DNA/RNA endonuclease YhcR with UshA esterase domain